MLSKPQYRGQFKKVDRIKTNLNKLGQSEIVYGFKNAIAKY